MATGILIVDDSGAMRSFVRATLEANEEVDVHEAASGFEALRLLPGSSYRLIIIDVNMSDINGLELMSLIRKNERYRDTPLIVISTESSDRDRSRALSLGASENLAKPFSPDALLGAVRRLTKGGKREEQ